MRTLRFAINAAVASCVVATAPVAQAQDIDRALDLYKDRDYEDAALAFYDVLDNDPSEANRAKAQIYLAETLRKMELYWPALFYYTDIYKVGREDDAGRENRYYLNAVEGMLELQKALHDPLFVPSLINEKLDTQAFGQLEQGHISHINYLVGELSFRGKKNQDARAFLEFVPRESAFYTRAQYLVGLLEVRAGNLQGALDHFLGLVEFVGPDPINDEEARMSRLGQLAAARAAYGLGRFTKASELYESVPRFSEQWFAALYENAWAYYKQGAHGKALGEVQSVLSPYFSKRHAPEAHVVSATTYFKNCQWDRVRREVGRFKRDYEPALTQLRDYLSAERDPAEYYRDVVAGGAGRFPREVARDVRRLRRFLDYHFGLEHLAWEVREVKDIDEWERSKLLRDINKIFNDFEPQALSSVGRWTRTQLLKHMNVLQGFQTQINIIDFEVADAERRWLEQGQEVLKGRRLRLPRPEIPNDQWQHWNFDREYWKDELGYIEHSLASECLEDLEG